MKTIDKQIRAVLRETEAKFRVLGEAYWSKVICPLCIKNRLSFVSAPDSLTGYCFFTTENGGLIFCYKGVVDRIGFSFLLPVFSVLNTPTVSGKTFGHFVPNYTYKP